MHRPHSVRQAPLAPITSILVGQRDREAPEGIMAPEASRWCRNRGFVQYMGPPSKGDYGHLQFQGPGHAHAYGNPLWGDALHLSVTESTSKKNQIRRIR